MNLKNLKLAFSTLLLSLLCGVTMGQDVSGKPADFRIKYNNDIVVDLGVGLWGIPLPMDWDKDGVMDIVVACPDTPYKGIYLFKNIGTNQKHLFDKAVLISERSANNIKLSEVDGKYRVLMHGFEYENFFDTFFAKRKSIKYQGPRVDEGIVKSRSKMWNYVDWDNDGDMDVVAGIDTWDDYGWDNAFNAKGEWLRGPLHGYVYLIENKHGKYMNQGKVQADGKDIDVYGAPNPCVADFDGDGDLDIICGEFVDGLTWFENKGTRTEPKFAKGRQLANKNGEIRLFLEMIVPVVSDFDKDGKPDLVIGDEDGRVAFLKNTGKIKNGMPQFESPSYLKQKADDVKFGALSTPFSYDWDGDGKVDIIAGNSAGNIAFIRNLSGGVNPSWAEPQFFTVNGKPLRIQAGYNGSIQGPAESKWGYTVLTVADWNGDGKPNIIINSIWGKIEWFATKGKKGSLELSTAQPVKVDWPAQAPKPAWNWWNPEPGTLTTQWRTTPYAIDWNKDGLMDLVMLDHEGYLCLFERFKKDNELLLHPGRRMFFGENGSEFNHKFEIVNPAPGALRLNCGEAGASGRRKFCLVDWDGDGDLDIVANSRNAEWFENVRTEGENVYFTYRGNIADVKLAGHTTSPTVVDWDNNGVPDILLGAEDGHFFLLKNNIK